MDDYCSQVGQVLLVYYVSVCVLLLSLINQMVYEYGDTYFVWTLKNEIIIKLPVPKKRKKKK